MNRFNLEDAISKMFNTDEELEILLYKIGDSPVPLTEDETLNIIIGIRELNKVRWERLWDSFEDGIKNGTISNKNTEGL
jgi:hypothetical protein|tara:strand:+ start:124 stop:360 length:237 start_codon:yes stop_codon:yes gene_type:complete